MKDSAADISGRLALVQGILQSAFFSPLHVNDWVAFAYGQPSLLNLEDAEVFDLFVRGAITAETMDPEGARGRTPLAWFSALRDPRPVLAHVLMSLKSDRPFLLHRVLFALPAVARGRFDPNDFEVAEDYLQKALEDKGRLDAASHSELEALRRRSLKAAGFTSGEVESEVAEAAAAILARPQLSEFKSDVELAMWLEMGDGLTGVEARLAPAVMAEIWCRWVGAVLGVEPDLDLLGRMHPELNLSSEELALHVPPDAGAGHVIESECPFCAERAMLRLGQGIEEINRCPHLVYVGTSDEAHLRNVLEHFELGGDMGELLDSYYQSPADLDLFATIVNDLYEMLSHQGRLATEPVSCKTAPKTFYNLRAYFAGQPLAGSTAH